MISAGNIVFRFLPFDGQAGVLSYTVIGKEKGKALHYELMPIISLAFYGVVDVTQGQWQVYDGIVRIQGKCA